MDLKNMLVVAGIATLIFACGNSSQPNERSVASSSEDTKELVEKNYGRKCAICHGRNGKLGASGAPDLTASKLDKDGVIAIITAGKGKMPPQKDVLSTQEIADLADYVINLRNAQ